MPRERRVFIWLTCKAPYFRHQTKFETMDLDLPLEPGPTRIDYSLGTVVYHEATDFSCFAQAIPLKVLRMSFRESRCFRDNRDGCVPELLAAIMLPESVEAVFSLRNVYDRLTFIFRLSKLDPPYPLNALKSDKPSTIVAPSWRASIRLRPSRYART